MTRTFGSSVWRSFWWCVAILACIAAVAGASAAGNLGGQAATYGGIGAGITVKSIPVFFDGYQVGSTAVEQGAGDGGGLLGEAPPAEPAPAP